MPGSLGGGGKNRYKPCVQAICGGMDSVLGLGRKVHHHGPRLRAQGRSVPGKEVVSTFVAVARKNQHAQQVFEVVRVLMGGGTKGAIPGTNVDGIGIGIRKLFVKWPNRFCGGIILPELLSLFMGFVNLWHEICPA